MEIQLWIDHLPSFPLRLPPSPHPPFWSRWVWCQNWWPELLLPACQHCKTSWAARSPRDALQGCSDCLALFLVSLKAVSQVLCKGSPSSKKQKQNRNRKKMEKRKKKRSKKGEKKRKSYQMRSSIPALLGVLDSQPQADEGSAWVFIIHWQRPCEEIK